MLNRYLILVKKKLSTVLPLLILVLPFPVTASDVTVTFEDLTTPTVFTSPGLNSSILDGYKGFKDGGILYPEGEILYQNIFFVANDFSGLESSSLETVQNIHSEWGLKIVVLNVGQSDAILVFAPNGDVCLIDSGKTESAGKKIYDYLNTELLNGIGKLGTIDLLYTTLYDQDHIGGIAKTVAKGIKIRKAFDQGLSTRRSVSTPTGKTSAYGKYVTAVGDPNNNLKQDDNEPDYVRHAIHFNHSEWIGIDDNIEINCVGVRGDTKGTDFDVDLDPSNKSGNFEENPGSIALVLRMGEFEFYTAGDQTGDGWKSKPAVEKSIINSGSINGGNDIDVLKVSHHGSDTSSGKTFLQSLDPEVSIISTRYIKGQGLPKKITLKQLQENNCYTLITGDGINPVIEDYNESKVTDEDDQWKASENAIFNNQGDITVLVSKDGSRYTVYSDSFTRTFSSKDEDNVH